MQEFGVVLARIRQEKGFKTAHSFYRIRRGRQNLGLTFRSYLNLEQGKSLPKPERFEAILLALEIEERSDAARRLVQAYMNSLGLGRLLRFFEEPTVRDPGEDDSMGWAVRRTIEKNVVHYVSAQWELLATNFDAYVCDDLLVMAPDGLTLPELARTSGLSLGAARRAVAALQRAGLACLSDGRVRSPFDVERHVIAAPDFIEMLGTKAALSRNLERLAQRSRKIEEHVCKVRMSPEGLRRFGKSLRQAVDAAVLFEDTHEDCATYMVRGQLFEIYSPP